MRQGHLSTIDWHEKYHANEVHVINYMTRVRSDTFFRNVISYEFSSKGVRKLCVINRVDHNHADIESNHVSIYHVSHSIQGLIWMEVKYIVFKVS